MFRLAPNAWYCFAIFAGVVTGLILEPMPAAAIGLIFLVTLLVIGTPYLLAIYG